MEKKNKKNPLKHPEQRVGVFIDVQNLYYSAKNLFGKKKILWKKQIQLRKNNFATKT